MGKETLWALCRNHPLEFTIPGHPPSINELYANVRGRRVKTRVGHKWESFSGIFVRTAAKDAYGTYNLHELKGKPLKLDIYFYSPSWKAKNGNLRRWDCDNHIKSFQDSLVSSLGLDDYSIMDLSAIKVESPLEIRTFARLIFLGDDYESD